MSQDPTPMRRITPPSGRPRRRLAVAAGVTAVLLVLGGATAVAAVAPEPSPTATDGDGGPATTLRLGYFGNVTHAAALVGVDDGYLKDALSADGTTLSTQVFNAGPAAIEALNAGAIDAAYVGPNPALNSFIKSGGQSVRVIAGAAAGGAQFVVRPGITTAAQLRGATLATPQLGGTQDVALRAWLHKHGLSAPADGHGDVTIDPTENAQTLALFRAGRIDGAWLPEPWASRLVLEAGAKVLVDEASLWDGTAATGAATGHPGQFPTTVLIVSQRFADAHPRTVEDLVRGHTAAVDWYQHASADQRVRTINTALTRATGKALPEPVLRRALARIVVTTDPLAAAWPRLLSDAVTTGLTRPADLTGLIDVRALNAIAAQTHRPAVSAAGLGED